MRRNTQTAKLVCDAFERQGQRLRARSLPSGHNAAMESWNHDLKVEAIHGERLATRGQAKAQVFDYIEIDDDRTRLHSALGYLSPEQSELAHIA